MSDYQIQHVFESKWDVFSKSINGKSLTRIFLIFTMLFLVAIVTGIRFFNQQTTIGFLLIVVLVEGVFSIFYLMTHFSKADNLWRGELTLKLKDENLELFFNEQTVLIPVIEINQILIQDERTLNILYGNKSLKLPFNDRPVLDSFLNEMQDKYSDLRSKSFEEGLRGKLKPIS